MNRLSRIIAPALIATAALSAAMPAQAAPSQTHYHAGQYDGRHDASGRAYDDAPHRWIGSAPRQGVAAQRERHAHELTTGLLREQSHAGDPG